MCFISSLFLGRNIGIYLLIDPTLADVTADEVSIQENVPGKIASPFHIYFQNLVRQLLKSKCRNAYLATFQVDSFP